MEKNRGKTVGKGSNGANLGFENKLWEMAATAKTEYTNPEDRDEYLADNIFWVPSEARWEGIQGRAICWTPTDSRRHTTCTMAWVRPGHRLRWPKSRTRRWRDSIPACR